MHGTNQPAAIASTGSPWAISVYTRAAGLIVLAVAVVVLTGWTIDSHALEDVVPGPSTMKPLTAASFLLSSIVLLASARPGGIARDRIGWFCAAVVTAWSGLTLLEYATGLDFH